MKTLLILVAVATLLGLGVAAHAYVWDNTADSYTYQMWGFDTAARSADPDVKDNNFGTATFSILGGMHFEEDPYGFTDRTGLWAGAFAGSATTTVITPTSDVAVDDKLIRLQMIMGCTNLSGIQGYNDGAIPGIALGGFGAGSASVESESMTALQDEQYGFLSEKIWRLTGSNSTAETITGNIVFSGGIICFDEVTVESIHTAQATEAVPEPMSIMLGIMGLGSVAGFRRLRRK